MAPPAPATSARRLYDGEGWRVLDLTCRSGPEDRPYQELHAWTSIAAVLSGTFVYNSSRGRALMTPGSLLLGAGGTCYECGHDHGRGDRCIAFQFGPELIEETTRVLPGVTSTDFKNVRIPPLDQLLPVFARIRALAGASAGLFVEELALAVAATAVALDQGTAETPPRARDERCVALAARIIEARQAEPLTIADLAREVGMGRRRFATVFRHVLGVTPYRYILNLRLAAAARRLEEERVSVLEIALDAGFGDLSEFTRRFHTQFGAPPGQYRRDVRQRRSARFR